MAEPMDESRPRPAASLDPNPDGTWTAWIGTASFDGTRQECVAWLMSEEPTYYPDAPARAAGGDHMPYLQTIWAAPLDPVPLRQYADWLDTVGHRGAAVYYRQKAADVASGRVQPEYPDRGWLDENWD
jgi:hypothetical protein